MKKISRNDILIDFLTFINYIEGDKDRFGYFSIEDFKKFRLFDESNYFTSIYEINKAICKEDIELLKKSNIYYKKDTIPEDYAEFPLTDTEIGTIKSILTNNDNYYYRFETPSEKDFDANLNLYKKLFELNKSRIPVTHFYFYTSKIEEQIRTQFLNFITGIEREYKIVENKLLGFENIFKRRLSNDIESALYLAIKNESFFAQGFVDDEGLFFDSNKNFMELINRASNDALFEKTLLDLNIDNINKEFVHSHSYLTFNWWNNIFLKNEIIQENLSEKSRQEINLDTQKFKDLYEWSNRTGLLNYLEKRFSTIQIKAILAVIARYDFSNLSIRSHKFDKLTELFTFCYYVGYFEFLSQIKQEDLNSINGFKILDEHLNFFENNVDIKVFRDYYKQKDSPTNKKRYPFNRREKVKEIITQRLGFNADKLQKISN